MEKPENGNAPQDVAIIKLTRSPWHLEVAGQVENFALYRVMLLEALRVVETQLRLQDMAQARAQMQDAAQLDALRQSVLGRTQ